MVKMIHLALSEHAATELRGYIDRGGQPVRAVDGHPVVIDQIAAELRSQLGGGESVPVTSATTVAQSVAAQMAAAGAAAIA